MFVVLLLCIHLCNKSLICISVEAATKAFYNGPWAHTGGYERGRILYRLADLIEKHKEELAQLEGI